MTATRLTEGVPLPSFTGLDHTGATRSSDEFSSSKVVIYFYPKAFTPGCTTESCDFRDRHEFFAAQGYEILGISPDSPERLTGFRAEHDLPFDLISDPDHSIAEAFAAWGEKKNYGKVYMGIIRSTFVVADGVVESAYYNVRAKGHAERISKELPNSSDVPGGGDTGT